MASLNAVSEGSRIHKILSWNSILRKSFVLERGDVGYILFSTVQVKYYVSWIVDSSRTRRLFRN